MLQALNHETYSESKMAGSQKDRKTVKISRKTRGKNVLPVFFDSDYNEELHSVKSDNPHMYARSRSSVSHFDYQTFCNLLIFQNTLDNTSTKKYLLQSRGKTFVKVESKMKTIENSLSNTMKNDPKNNKTFRYETKDQSYVVSNLRRDIMMKEQFISQ